jgi:hypothetical protein
MSDCRKPTHTFEGNAYNPTQVRLYGRPHLDTRGLMNALRSYGIELNVRRNGNDKKGKEGTADPGIRGLLIKAQELNEVFLINLTDEHNPMSSGVIFGYAFEGHCYDLPKPKIMLIPADPEPLACDDCGYDLKRECDYMVWVVDKLQRCVEIEVNQGFIEQIVLEANVPGKRSPTTYRATMQVAHRSGRLTE